MNSTFKTANKVKLEGIAIGDGWTDPINQINYYDSYLYSAGIVSNKFRDVCTWFQTNAIVQIYDNKYENVPNLFKLGYFLFRLFN
jgi:vitellogenic carboxypeptidase-like protein